MNICLGVQILGPVSDALGDDVEASEWLLADRYEPTMTVSDHRFEEQLCAYC